MLSVRWPKFFFGLYMYNEPEPAILETTTWLVFSSTLLWRCSEIPVLILCIVDCYLWTECHVKRHIAAYTGCNVSLSLCDLSVSKITTFFFFFKRAMFLVPPACFLRLLWDSSIVHPSIHKYSMLTVIRDKRRTLVVEVLMSFRQFYTLCPWFLWAFKRPQLLHALKWTVLLFVMKFYVLKIKHLTHIFLITIFLFSQNPKEERHEDEGEVFIWSPLIVLIFLRRWPLSIGESGRSSI